MKSYFPFTDYDFWAYLASGCLLLFSVDYAIMGGRFMFREHWPFVEIVLAVSLAYAVGQLSTSLSSPILEHWLARSVLYPPISLQVGLVQPQGCSVLSRSC